MYEIMMADRVIGTVEVMREGLYYRFQCRCRLPDDLMYQLKVVCADKETSLGICIPIGDAFGVDTRLAVKVVGEGAFSFYVSPRHADLKGQFAPIRDVEPFAYIDKLKNARLHIRNGEIGAIIHEEY